MRDWFGCMRRGVKLRKPPRGSPHSPTNARPTGGRARDDGEPRRSDLTRASMLAFSLGTVFYLAPAGSRALPTGRASASIVAPPWQTPPALQQAHRFPSGGRVRNLAR